MISKITLKNITSYGDNGATLETNKALNLIYGLNGAGKTTISNYLENIDDPKYEKCNIDGLGNEKILVYNGSFVSKNFYQDKQKGIFSLKSENKEAKEKIDEAEKNIKLFKKQINNENVGLEFELNKKKEDINNLQNQSELKTWKIKTDYSGGDRVLEFCLDGKKGSKKALFDYICSIRKTDEMPIDKIEDLKKEIEVIQEENIVKYDISKIKKINFDFSKIEDLRIFKEGIIGNENSQVAELVNVLNNSDWVKKGIDYMKKPAEENTICPFCQQKNITKTLYEEIKNYFDENYDKKINELKSVEHEYYNEIEKIKENKEMLLSINFIKNKENEFKPLIDNFIARLDNNLHNIRDKIKNPSNIINLQSTLAEKEQVNQFLQNIIKEIEDFNKKLDDKETIKQEAVRKFWNILRWEYDGAISIYFNEKQKLENEIKNIENRISDFRKKIDEQQNIIKESQKDMVNIQEAVDAINSQLILFGLDDFCIISADNESYKLKRPNENITNFKTLSEGEKTVISFLYFLELCKGKENKDEAINEKIIVIDDPISSLSHMYVYNVSQLIRSHFLNNNYKQVFILTHNLYFLHELLHQQKNEKIQLFRIIKSDFSYISTMDRKEIQNEYQSYWQILKDYNNSKATEVILANAMRNIIERFFGFINDINSFNEVTKKLEEAKENKFFLRYINKESHSDSINITDSKDINPKIFFRAFKQIFNDAGYIEHYNKMMSDI